MFCRVEDFGFAEHDVGAFLFGSEKRGTEVPLLRVQAKRGGLEDDIVCDQRSNIVRIEVNGSYHQSNGTIKHLSA